MRSSGRPWLVSGRPMRSSGRAWLVSGRPRPALSRRGRDPEGEIFELIVCKTKSYQYLNRTSRTVRAGKSLTWSQYLQILYSLQTAQIVLKLFCREWELRVQTASLEMEFTI